VRAIRKRHRVSGTAAASWTRPRSPALTRLGLAVRGLRRCAAGWKPALRGEESRHGLKTRASLSTGEPAPREAQSPALTRLGLPVRGLRRCAAGWKPARLSGTGEPAPREAQSPALTRSGLAEGGVRGGDTEASPRERYGCRKLDSASVPSAHAIGACGAGSAEVRRGLETRAPLRHGLETHATTRRGQSRAAAAGRPSDRRGRPALWHPGRESAACRSRESPCHRGRRPARP